MDRVLCNNHVFFCVITGWSKPIVTKYVILHLINDKKYVNFLKSNVFLF